MALRDPIAGQSGKVQEAHQWSKPGSVESLRLGDEIAQFGEKTSFPWGDGAWICGRRHG